jgi:hypothetical protein
MKKKLFFVAAILGISLAVLGLSLLSNQGAAKAALTSVNTLDCNPGDEACLAASKALDWLAIQQSAEDGGYGSASASVDTMFSISSADFRSGDWKRSSSAPSLLGYMMQNGTAYSKNGVAEAGKLSSSLIYSQGCLPLGAKTVMDYYDSETGKYADEAGFHVWGMIGTAAMSETIPVLATNYLKSLQLSSGGWEWVPGGFGGGEDTNTTALSIQALIAAGEATDSKAVTDGLDWIKSTQNDDGGFPYDPDSTWGTDSDTNSTAFVVQAVLAAGQDPMSADWKKNDIHPISYLLNMQLENGSFEFMPGFGADLMATQQAIPALLEKYHPYLISSLDDCDTCFLPQIIR